MKGIILAGGTASRLGALSKVTNKHLLPVGKKPMIYRPIEKLITAGIKDILIVTGTEHMGAIVSLLGSGRNFGCSFTYRIQDVAGGIAQAIGLAKGFAKDEKIVVILGDNVFEDDITSYVRDFEKQERGAKILLSEVEDPHRFGVAEIENDVVKDIVEKPDFPKTNLAVVGVYMYDSIVFSVIDTLQPSARGELEVTDINKHYIRYSTLSYDVLKGWWTDAGTFASLKKANDLIGDN